MNLTCYGHFIYGISECQAVALFLPCLLLGMFLIQIILYIILFPFVWIYIVIKHYIKKQRS